MDVKYVHTNLVARNWKRLAAFYVEVFGCKPKPPERDLKGEWLEALTSQNGAHVRGIHLRLPGYQSDGPTLEVFQYSTRKSRSSPQTEQPGYGHVAFGVKDVGKMIEKIKKNGGRLLGKRVTAAIDGVGRIDVVYARDPEGNVIEVQKWTQ
jgi:predicted enzyme related to lactoylglutathione lyase